MKSLCMIVMISFQIKKVEHYGAIPKLILKKIISLMNLKLGDTLLSLQHSKPS